MKKEYRFALAALVVGVLGTLVFLAVMGGFPGFGGSPTGQFYAADMPSGSNTVTVQSLVRTGAAFTTQASDAQGDWCLNDGKTFWYWDNQDVTTHTVTVVTPITVGGLAVADLSITLGPGADYIAGPFNPLWFNDLSGTDSGKMYCTYDSVTTQTVAAVSWAK